MVDLPSLHDSENFALQSMGAVATISMVVRVAILVIVEDCFKIREQYQKWKREVEKKADEL